MVWETVGKQQPARWQQSSSNASDPLAFPLAFLENDLKIHVLLAAMKVACVVAVTVASLNYLKIHVLLAAMEFVFLLQTVCCLVVYTGSIRIQITILVRSESLE